MSIVIPNMKMPKTCRECHMRDGYWCYIDRCVGETMRNERRRKDCPLVELPPHGRLVDADKILDKLREYLSVLSCEPDIANRIYEIVFDAPTVLEASEGE